MHLILEILHQHPFRWALGLLGLALALASRDRAGSPSIEGEGLGGVQRQDNPLL